MQHKHKILSALLTAGAFLLTGCGSITPQNRGGADGRLRIVCSVFPEYDWTRQMLPCG